MSNTILLSQDSYWSALTPERQRSMADELKTFLGVWDLTLLDSPDTVTTSEGDHILGGDVFMLNGQKCKAQVYLQKDLQWFIIAFTLPTDWNFGKCYPQMQGMPQFMLRTDNPSGPPANDAGTFLLCNETLSNTLGVYVYAPDTADKSTLTSALKTLDLWKNWSETGKDTLIGGLDDFGKQTCLYFWGNYPELPKVLLDMFDALILSYKSSILQGKVYRPGSSGLVSGGNTRVFSTKFPVLRLEMPLAQTDNLFDPKVSGKLDLVLHAPLYYYPGNSFIGLLGDVKIALNKTESLDVSLELDYSLDSDIIRGIGKFKDTKLPLVDTQKLPEGLVTKTQNLELDLVVEFSRTRKKLTSVAFGVEMQNWELFGKKITLQDLLFEFRVIDPINHRYVMANLNATASIGTDLKLTCGGAYPSGQMYLALNSQGHKLSDVLTSFGFQIPKDAGIPTLDIQDLRVEYNYFSNRLYAGIDLVGPWAIHWFKLENFKFHLTSGSGNMGLSLSADIQLGDIPVMLSAEYAVSGSTGTWNFLGRASDIPVGTFITTLFDKLNTTVVLPEQLHELQIGYMEMSFSNGTETDFNFSLELQYPKNGEVIDLLLGIKLIKKAPATGSGNTAPKTGDDYSVVITSHMLIGGKVFDFAFDKEETADVDTVLMVAKTNDLHVDLKELAGSVIEDDKVSALIPSVDIAPRYILFAWVNDKAAGGAAPVTKKLTGLDLDVDIDLKGLPLVGKLLGNASLQIKDLQFLYATDNLTSKEIQVLNSQGLLPASLPEQSPNGMSTNPAAAAAGTVIAKGLGIRASVLVGSLDPFRLMIPAQPRSGEAPALPSGTENAAPAETATTDVQPTTPTATIPGGDATWIDIQQAIGPLQINRIGFNYKDQMIWGYLDASLNLTGFSLSLDGLGVGNPINTFSPSFTLNGLGLDFKRGALEIGGAFLRTKVSDGTETYEEYDGMAVFKMEEFSFSAIGSYANYNGQDSLFLYAMLNYPIGGPAFFFVTGIAAGFGYNRKLNMPSISEVGRFPLVNEVLGGAGSTPISGTDVLTQRRNLLQTEIDKLRTAISPANGRYFLAAGVRFSTFEMIDSFVLLSIEFGRQFEVDVLGLSTLIIPTPEPNAAQAVEPVAEVQLALRAVLKPDEGILSIEAQLTNNSYLFSRACHLTGGFAFYSWFDGPHKGDFVVTLGGYHPRFNVPAHYPAVPRLGFNWSYSNELVLKGEAYFALTSHALMAGGKLEAVFQKGSIRAWFVAGADFIISWKPYFYDAQLFVEVGASYTFWLFGTRTVTFELGADLHVWGPDFSGEATIHYHSISFNIKFGHADGKPKPVSWDVFRSSFLPSTEKICAITAAAGLVKEDQTGNAADKRAVFNPKDLAIAINTMVPVKTFDLNIAQITEHDKLYFADDARRVLLPYSSSTDTGHARSTTPFGIAPMDVSEVDDSHLSITITDEDKQTVNEHFSFTPVLKRMPRAMWGNNQTAEVNGEQFVEDTLTGFVIRPAILTKPGQTHKISKENLQYETDPVANAFNVNFLVPFSYFKQGEVDFEDYDRASSQGIDLLSTLGIETTTLHLPNKEQLESFFVKQPIEVISILIK